MLNNTLLLNNALYNLEVNMCRKTSNSEHVFIAVLQLSPIIQAFSLNVFSKFVN